MGFGALVFMLVGFMMPVGKLIVVECLAVVQVGFFSVLQLEIVPVTYYDLKYLVYSTGYFDMSAIVTTNETQ